MVSFQASGIIISPINKGREYEQYLKELPIPTVLIGNDLKRTTSVGIDEYQATVDAVKYIMHKGYRNIIFCCPPLKDDDGKNNLGHVLRLKGYKDTMKSYNLKSCCIYGEEYLTQVEKSMKRSVDKPAYLCSGDIFANEVMTYLHQKGYMVKKDFGVMGFDFVQAYQNGIVNITTIDNHISSIGDKAAQILLDMINGKLPREEYHHEIIRYDIKEGNTL